MTTTNATTATPARCGDCGRTGTNHLTGCLTHPDPTKRHPFAATLETLPDHIDADGRPACGGFQGCPACEDHAAIIERDDETLPWVPTLVRRRGGAVWCVECDAPFVLCGSIVHNPNHHTEAGTTRTNNSEAGR